MTRASKKLSDAELFAAAMSGAVPLRKTRITVRPEPAARKEAPSPAPTIRTDAPPARRETPVAPNPGLDRRTEEKLRKGRLPIDRQLDLHGMTEANAHAALDRCVRQSWERGARVVLVITGKGRAGEGVLRRNLPRWLKVGDNAAWVLRAVPAQPKDGGDGAFYVLLRRRREP